MANLTVTVCRPVQVVSQFQAPALVAITAGQYCIIDPTTGKWKLGQGTTAPLSRNGGLATHDVAIGEPLTCITKGIVDVGNALTALTYDVDVYIGDTAGTLSDTAGTVTKIVGTVRPAFGSVTPDKLLRVDL